MKFTPMTEKEAEAQSSDLWPDGAYDFEVREATEKTSSTGNEMTELEVWIYNSTGSRRLVFDYLTVSEKAAWKIRSFAAATGLLPQYDSGTLDAADMVGRTGRCMLMIEPARDSYPAKNKIKSYTKAEGATPRTGNRVHGKVSADDLSDSIPF